MATKMIPFFRQERAARANDAFHDVNISNLGVRGSMALKRTQTQTPVGVVRVSEYVSLDVSSHVFYDVLKATSHRNME